MEAIQSRVESGPWNAGVKWVGHNAPWLGAIVLAFFLGAGWMNGRATDTAVHSVQTTYQGKLQYHVQHEKVLAKTAQTATIACERNLHAALEAQVDQDLNGCPKAPATSP